MKSSIGISAVGTRRLLSVSRPTLAAVRGVHDSTAALPAVGGRVDDTDVHADTGTSEANAAGVIDTIGARHASQRLTGSTTGVQAVAERAAP